MAQLPDLLAADAAARARAPPSAPPPALLAVGCVRHISPKALAFRDTLVKLAFAGECNPPDTTQTHAMLAVLGVVWPDIGHGQIVAGLRRLCDAGYLPPQP